MTLRSAQSRWPYALRAAFAMGLPVIAGWAVNDPGAGLTATLGAFTALYGSGRPYLSRLRLLSIVACCFSLAVWLGGSAAAAASPWPPILVVALIATVGTWLCNSLRVGPPGAYMIVLVCAAGTFMRTEGIDPTQAAALTLAGGVFAVLIHMSGALVQPRTPEKRAVVAAAQRLIEFVSAAGSPREAVAQHLAASSLHQAWSTLVTYQPFPPRPNSTLYRLRVVNRRLNQLFADLNGRLSRHEPVPASAIDDARLLASQAQDPEAVSEADDLVIPLGSAGPLTALRHSISPSSWEFRVALRVGLATLLAGAAASELGLERAYWTMAAAVLMLHQGLDVTRSLQRGLDRILGTLVGLVIAWVVISMHPTGLWLAATLMGFQFLIEIFVMRNYAIAVAFITPIALTIAAGGHESVSATHLLTARGLDTLLGCVIAIAVLLVTTPKHAKRTLYPAFQRLIKAADSVLACLETGSAIDHAARSARRDLQLQALAVMQAYEESIGASIRGRKAAESFWPAVVASQRLSYTILAACWDIERASPNSQTAFSIGSARRSLAAIAVGLEARAIPFADDDSVGEFLQPEIAALRHSFAAVERSAG